MTVNELLYGDVESCYTSRALKAGEIIAVGSRFGVVENDVVKSETGNVICSSPFVYECSADYFVCEGDPVYFDLKRQAFVPAGTRGAKEIGTAAITCKIGDKMVVVQING